MTSLSGREKAGEGDRGKKPGEEDSGFVALDAVGKIYMWRVTVARTTAISQAAVRTRKVVQLDRSVVEVLPVEYCRVGVVTL